MTATAAGSLTRPPKASSVHSSAGSGRYASTSIPELPQMGVAASATSSSTNTLPVSRRRSGLVVASTTR